ncbi:MAG TPA: hypothetical protein VGI43_02660 [Mucilaginibacter sp.]|jgi:hypothetical protein
MKKFLWAIIVFGSMITGSFAQSTGFGKFNLGLYGALPLTNMRQIFNAGVGGSLKYEYRLGSLPFSGKPGFLNNLFFSLESGYEAFDVKKELQNAYVPSTYGYVPVKFGLKYYAVKGLYAEWQSGICFFTQHGGGHSFDFSPGIGYSFKQGFEIGLRYEQWTQKPEKHITGDYGQSGPFAKESNFQQLQLRIAERF